MKMYTKKPIPIKAEQFDYQLINDVVVKRIAILESKNNRYRYGYGHGNIIKEKFPLIGDNIYKGNIFPKDGNYYVKTLEGDMLIEDGSYIIEGVRGEIYACKQDIFEETYQEYDKNEVELQKISIRMYEKSIIEERMKKIEELCSLVDSNGEKVFDREWLEEKYINKYIK